MIPHEVKRVLIWGKTYPELSDNHRETVCTGGCLPDGTPVRLYPVDLRYLEKHKQYKLYDWIEVPLARNTKDPRPESYKVDATKLSWVGHVDTDRSGWAERRQTIFANRSWHYACLEDLKARQERDKSSFGMIPVREVLSINLERRPKSDEQDHQKKLRALQERGPDFFGVVQKDLEFIPYRLKLAWRCQTRGCPGHTGSVMDWGILELGRRDGWDKAEARLEDIADLERHDLHLYVGNLFSRQHVFTIIGLWFPPNIAQGVLL